MNITKERILGQPLDDQELLELQFDLNNRVRVPAFDLPINVVRLGLEQFAKREACRAPGTRTRRIVLALHLHTSGISYL